MFKLALPLLVLTVVICGGSVQSQAPVAAPMPESGGVMPPGLAFAPAPTLPPLDCTSAMLNVSSCLTYVEQGSNATVPEKGCCPSLASLVDNQPVCLCQLLSNSDTFGIQIDTTRALKLPAACRISTPDVSLCDALGIPVASPGPNSQAPDSRGAMELGMGAPASAPASNGADAGTSAGIMVLAAAVALLVFGCRIRDGVGMGISFHE